MDVRFCEGRNPCREALVRTVSSRSFVLRALPSTPGAVRVPLDKDLHGSRLCAEVPAGVNSRDTGMWAMPNRGTCGLVGGSDITFRRHRRVVINLSVRLASFI